jgi:hypothetical protein
MMHITLYIGRVNDNKCASSCLFYLLMLLLELHTITHGSSSDIVHSEVLSCLQRQWFSHGMAIVKET